MHRFLTSAALAPSAGSISVAAEDIGDLCAAALLVDPAVAPERLEFRTSLQAPEAVTDAPRALQGNPRVRLASADTAAPSAPEAWARVPRADSPFVAWVEDPVRELVFCFWLTRDEAETVRGLDEGSRSPAKLEPELRGALLAAGVLVDPGERDRARRRWKESIAEARELLARKGYATLPQLLSPPIAEAISHYYRAAADNGFLFPDDQGSFLYGHHNEPLAVWLHQHLSPLLASVIPEPVKPSYSFVAVYGEGGELLPHTDRPQCEYTLSIAAGMHRVGVAATPDSWPIYLDTPDVLVEARLGLGDAVLFKGREIPHFRRRLEGVSASVSVLCHFVPEDFDGPLD